MTKLISHRGNLNGKIPERENTMPYIIEAIEQGYFVEIDVWAEGDKLYLGHDVGVNEITIGDLMQYSDKLFIHCKNIQALNKFSSFSMFNYFVHNTDFCTITSKGDLWAFPGNSIKNSIFVLPDEYEMDFTVCSGICSDFISSYKQYV